MKTKLNGILTLFLAFLVQISFAQEKTITGIVKSNLDVLPGVSITIKDSSVGTETDFNGKYSIKAKPGDVLVFRYLGYKTTEKTVSSTNIINVTLVEDANELEEIVVTALGIKREKQSLGFAQQTVESKDLVRTREPDISTALAGKVAGVQLQGTPSSGFGNSTIRIRGNTNVLFVVDGIRLNNAVDVNTDDIDDISILKGAAATALYGPTAVNGVVVITSKTAKKGQSNVDVNWSTSIDNLYLLPDYQNEYGGGYNSAAGRDPNAFDVFTYNPSIHDPSWAQFEGHLMPQYYADESWGPKLEGQMVRHWDSWIEGDPEFGKLREWSPQPNNVRDFFQTGVTNNLSVSYLKGGEDYSIRASINKIDRKLIYTNSDRNQTNASINANLNITKKLKTYAFVNFQDRRTQNFPDNGYNTVISNFNQWWQRQLDIDRLRDYKRNGQVVSWNIQSETNSTPLYWDSPFFEVYENLNFQTKNALYGKIGLTYEFNDNLNATLEVRKTFNSYEYNNRTGFGGLNVESYSESENTDFQDELFGIINYEGDITDNLDIQATLGFEINDNRYKSISGASVGGLSTLDFYSLSSSIDRPSLSSYYSRIKRHSTFSKVSFGFLNMLYLDGSARLDWQSTANPETNRVETYGGSLSFIFSKIIPKNDILTFGKLRASTAEAPSFPSVYANNIVYGGGTPYGSYGVQTLSSTYPNPNLYGGKRSEIEFGTELKFLQSRIGLDITYFKKVDKELPVGVTLNPATGYTSTTTNAGQQTYNGMEYTLFANPIKTKTVNWDFNLNFATLKRFVDKISDTSDENSIGGTWGLSLVERVGEEWGAMYGRKYRRDEEGRKILSSTGSPRYDDSQYLGNYLPDFTGGMSHNIAVGNFNIGFDLDFQKGGKIFSVSQMFGAYSGVLDFTTDDNALGNPKRDEVTPSNSARNYYVNLEDADSNSGGVLIEGVDETTGEEVSYLVNPYYYYKRLYGMTEEWLFDNSYVKLRTMRVDYNLPSSILEKTPFKAVNLGVYANNLWMIYTSVPNTDVSEISSGYAETGQNPNVRTFGINAKITF
ncbi:SusC/RagA family TonB-linked outer membrane protein [Polaribacter sargassicola]|uniref:SusC/RagA family TonB-linked outer membrane protein n=1 Tax=Polaribacter sargassicola TaxID=2836891 RepID=UPI001EFF7C92|nr:SusC/RagA family TonB-linked outer membrane protein [Polaribacter sp. DS7-9]MCG1035706.1 SusC/RagA family TonB-linked outer membrane protein [Polaribacter sp. DS7-9]